jgi:RNA polymerase sigma-70 factor (ECF subfamily)
VILGAAEGRPLDREEFARRYGLAIRAYLGARWRGSPLHPEIDDAAQDVFVECFKEGGALSRAEPGRKGGFRGFLYGVIRNVARRSEERWARRDKQVASGIDLEGAEDPASRAFDRAWAQAIMRQATELQAERAKAGGETARRRVELLRLRFAEGKPIRDIAEQWGKEPRQVQYEYKCAREEFQAALVDVVRRHEPSADANAEGARLVALLAPS